MDGPKAKSEELPEEWGAQPLAVERQKGRKALSRLKRELSEDELSSTGVQKMLLEEIERIEEDRARLTEYRDKFYASDKEVAILKQQAKQSLAGEMVFGACLTVGS